MKLNQSGFAHWLAPLVVVLVVGAVGARVIAGSHADSLANSNAAIAGSKSDLTNVGTVNVPGNQLSYFKVNSKLGVAYSSDNFKITVWSLADPTNPQQITSIPSPASNLAVSSNGDYLYAINGNVLGIYQTSSSTSTPLTYLGQALINGAQPDGLTVRGNYAYVVDWASTTAQPKVEVYDVSDKTAPKEVAALSANSDLLKSPTDVSLNGNYAYITSDANNTLNVFDVSKPNSPVYVSKVSLTPGLYNNAAGSVVFKQDYAYVAGINANVINIVNISNPSSPALTGTVTPPSQTQGYDDDPYGLLINNNKLFVDTINGNNLLLLSYSVASNVASPQYDQTVGLNGNDPKDMTTYGNYLYQLANVANGPSASTIYVYKIK